MPLKDSVRVTVDMSYPHLPKDDEEREANEYKPIDKRKALRKMFFIIGFPYHQNNFFCHFSKYIYKNHNLF